MNIGKHIFPYHREQRFMQNCSDGIHTGVSLERIKFDVRLDAEHYRDEVKSKGIMQRTVTGAGSRSDRKRCRQNRTSKSETIIAGGNGVSPSL